jgi:hypothetical protein
MSVMNQQRPPPKDLPADRGVRVLVVVEGPNDVEFLRRISRVVHTREADLPDLATMERQGQLIFVPLGGGGIAAWDNRLAPLGLPEFYLFDRELPPETDVRQAIVDRVNQRDGCHAVLTRKRSVENYLHPLALERAGGVPIEFGDFDPLADFVAKASFEESQPAMPWELLPRRAWRRLANRAKRWLNTRVVDQMTPELLDARDPDGEVRSWLGAIARLVSGARSQSAPSPKSEF